jgi:hypothetical protein
LPTSLISTTIAFENGLSDNTPNLSLSTTISTRTKNTCRQLPTPLNTSGNTRISLSQNNKQNLNSNKTTTNKKLAKRKTKRRRKKLKSKNYRLFKLLERKSIIMGSNIVRLLAANLWMKLWSGPRM